MGKEFVSSSDLGLAGDNNPFADSTPETSAAKKEAKTVRPASKMQAAASTAVAPPVESPMPIASAPAPVVLPPTPTASAPAVPPVTNPATTGDFWKGALTSAIPTVLGGLGLTAGGYLAGRGRGGGGSGGTATPVVDEEMRQIKLAQEQAKHESIIARNYREQEAHQSKMSLEVKRAEAILQRNQGKSVLPTSADAQATQLLVKSEENKLSKAVEASKPKPVTNAALPPVAPQVPVAPEPVAPVGRSMPAHVWPEGTTQTAPATNAPAMQAPATLEPTPKVSPTEVIPPAPTAKQASNIKEISLPKEWPSKGMNWLAAQYGIEGAQQFIDKYNDGKPFKTHAEMDAVYQKVMTKPSFSTMPKELRKERGIKASERELLKIIPRSVPPPSVGGSAGPTQGGGSLGGNRPGEDFMHNLNPLKL